MASIPITHASLREAIRDPRYWQDGHPERKAYTDWVADGYQALEGSRLQNGEGRTMVFVSAYTRQRDGRTEQVSAYVQNRSSPGGREDARTQNAGSAENSKRSFEDKPHSGSTSGSLITLIGTEGTPGNNQAQNAQIKAVVRILGLNSSQREQLHREYPA